MLRAEQHADQLFCAQLFALEANDNEE